MLDWKYRPKTDEELEAERKKRAQKEQEREEKPEGFASKNAKTITFVVMLTLFLAFFGPISVFTIYKQISRAEENQGAEMTEADLIALGKLGTALTMDDLHRYEGTESENEYRRTYVIRMEKYLINAMEDKSTGALSVLLTNVETEEQIDMVYEDVEAFLASH